VIDDDASVGELIGFVETLGRQEQCRAVADQVAQHLSQLDAAARIGPGRRLVEEEHGWMGDQADREVDPAPHPPGVGLDHLPARVGQREPVEHFARARPHDPPRQPIQITDEEKILAAGQ